jgi:hypothetical protein
VAQAVQAWAPKCKYWGPYPDGDASNRVRVFAYVDRTPGSLCPRKAGRKGPRDGREPGENWGRIGSKTRKDSNPGPYPDGDASNRVRVFAVVNRSPGSLCPRKAGQKGPRDGREPGENRGRSSSKTRRDGNPGPYPDGDASNRVQLFAYVDRKSLSPKGRPKRTRDGREPGENRGGIGSKTRRDGDASNFPAGISASSPSLVRGWSPFVAVSGISRRRAVRGCVSPVSIHISGSSTELRNMKVISSRVCVLRVRRLLSPSHRLIRLLPLSNLATVFITTALPADEEDLVADGRVGNDQRRQRGTGSRPPRRRQARQHDFYYSHHHRDRPMFVCCRRVGVDGGRR